MTTQTNPFAKQFCALAAMQPPTFAQRIGRGELADELRTWLASARQTIDFLIADAGRLLAEAFDADALPVPAIEVRSVLNDVRIAGAYSHALAVWFVTAVRWFQQYQRQGMLPDVACKFPLPAIEADDDLPAWRRPQPVTLTPREQLEKEFATLRDVLLAFAALVESGKPAHTIN